MATKTYGSSVIGDQVTVQSGGTVAVSLAFNTTVGLIGGHDASTGTYNRASDGDIVEVSSVSEAQTLFGDGSELHRATKLAYNNGVSEVQAAPVSETTSHTESFSSTQSGTLTNAPAFDPNVNTEHDITATDTTAGASVTVNIVYDDAPSAPSSSNEMNLNPVNGEWKADASSSYDITHDYGDYSSAITAMKDEDVRFICVLTENSGVASTLATELGNRADNFDFKHGVVGAMPETSAGSYTDSHDDFRLSVVAPSRGTSTDNVAVRTVAAVAGKLTSRPLGDSATYESVEGLESLKTDYTDSDIKDLINAQVLPLKERTNVEVIRDMTTSTDSKFERVFATEIVDEATELSHEVATGYVGELNTGDNRDSLRTDHVTFLTDMREDRPPLLDNYSVNVTEGTSSTEVDIEIGLDVVDVIDTIDTTVTVGDVVTNGATQ